MRNAAFRKSSYSNATGECVEVGLASPRLVAIRDSKDAAGSWLYFSPDGWQDFVSQVRDHGSGRESLT